MKRTKLSFYFIFIAFFTVFTFFVSIVQSSYNDLIKPVNQLKGSNLAPLDSKLDLSVIDEIEKRADYSEDMPLKVSSDAASFAVTNNAAVSSTAATPSSKSATNP